MKSLGPKEWEKCQVQGFWKLFAKECHPSVDLRSLCSLRFHSFLFIYSPVQTGLGFLIVVGLLLVVTILVQLKSDSLLQSISKDQERKSIKELAFGFGMTMIITLTSLILKSAFSSSESNSVLYRIIALLIFTTYGSLPPLTAIRNSDKMRQMLKNLVTFKFMKNSVNPISICWKIILITLFE